MGGSDQHQQRQFEVENPGTATNEAMEVDPPHSASSRVFLNPLVFGNITKNLAPEQLLVLRQTCTLWNDAILPHLQTDHDQQPVIKLKNAAEGHSSMQEYTDLVRRYHERIPYTKYHLQDPTCCPVRLFDFFCVCRDSVKSMVLEWRNEANMSLTQLRLVFFRLVPQLAELKLFLNPVAKILSIVQLGDGESNEADRLACEIPHLKRLRFESLETLDNPSSPELQQLLSDVFHGASGLEFLSIKEISHIQHRTLSILQALNDHGSQVGKLQTLEIYNIRTESLQILMDLAGSPSNALRLHSFGVSVQAGRDFNVVAESLLLEFLTTQAETLRELRIKITCLFHNSRHISIDFIRLPRMPNLRLFQLGRHGSSGLFTVKYETGALTTTFPSLNRFIFGNSSSSRGTDPNFAKDLCLIQQPGQEQEADAPAVTDVTLHGKMELPVMWVSLSRVFLFVTLLDISLPTTKGSAAKCLWTAWPTLKRLRVRYRPTSAAAKKAPLDVDGFVTGVTRPGGLMDSAVVVGEHVQESGLEPDGLVAVLDILRQMSKLKCHKMKPGIADLKQLEEFVLDVQDRDYRVTDVGGYFGFALASHRLQKIIIQRSTVKRRVHQNNLVSADCEKLIRAAFGQHSYVEIAL